MEVTLTVIRGKVSRSEIACHPPAVVGRSREADLTIAHPMISRQHCELYEIDGLLMVRDLGSLNGTLVGDQRVVESPLRPDDQFTVGPITFQVRYEYDGDLSAVPAPTVAEPAGTESPPGISAATEPAPSDEPRFSEIDAEPAGPRAEKQPPWARAMPDVEEGPWSDPVGAEEEVPWAEAMPADEEPGESGPADGFFGFTPATESEPGAESPPGAAALEPTESVPSKWAAAEDTVEDEPREVESPGVRGANLPASPHGKRKRGWKLWPFGSKKTAKQTQEGPAAALAGSQESPAAEPPEEAHGAVESPSEPPGTPDTPEDEAVAEFLADAPDELHEADPAQPDRQPGPHDEVESEAEPEGENEDTGEDGALDDFLKGLA